MRWGGSSMRYCWPNCMGHDGLLVEHGLDATANRPAWVAESPQTPISFGRILTYLEGPFWCHLQRERKRKGEPSAPIPNWHCRQSLWLSSKSHIREIQLKQKRVNNRTPELSDAWGEEQGRGGGGCRGESIGLGCNILGNHMAKMQQPVYSNSFSQLLL